MIGIKIADKTTNVSKKKFMKELPNNNNNNNNNNDNDNETDVEITAHKKDIHLQKKDSKLLIN